MIAEGKYNAKGIEGALTTSKEKGTPAVQVILEIAEGEHAGERMRWDGWLTDATSQRTLESLRYLGWHGDMLTDLTGITENVVQIVVEHESREVNGEHKTFPRVKWINRIGGGAKISDEARMPSQAANALAQRFRAQARGIAAATAGPSKPAAAKPATRPNGARPTRDPGAEKAPDFGDDDIPF